MMTYVVDAPIATEYLLRTPIGLQVQPIMDNEALIAPAILDTEVFTILERAVRHNLLPPERAVEVLQDLHVWPIQRFPVVDLLFDAWTHRHTLSLSDALYVATARATTATLLTADGPLAHMPNLGIAVHNVRLA